MTELGADTVPTPEERPTSGGLSRRKILGGLAAGAGVAAASTFAAWWGLTRSGDSGSASDASGSPGLGPATGDADLIRRVEPLLRAAGVRDRASVVDLRDGSTVEAHFGASRDTVYEIGSITKTMTGLLLAEVSTSGGLGAQTVLGSLLDLGTSPAAAVTLEELVSHRSGLPRLPSDALDSGDEAALQHRNPYLEDLATLLKQARGAKISGRGSFRYSNLGVALLGQALAAHAGVPYPELLGREVFGRFGMKQTTVPLTKDDLPLGASSGWSADGAPEEPWTLNSYAPAGGVRSTPADMTRYAAALLDREFPLAWALDPRWDAEEGSQVGYAWMTDRVDGRDITWHNGGTGGFASMLALDRTRARAVLVVVNTAVAVDEIAIRVLLDEA